MTVLEHCTRRLSDLRKVWQAYLEGVEPPEDLPELWEYGLGFDYVPGGDGQEPYFRYQFSWGGPQEELRYYCGPDLIPYRVEFWFLDWFRGESVELTESDLALALEVFRCFKEAGSVTRALELAG